MMFIYAIALFL